MKNLEPTGALQSSVIRIVVLVYSFVIAAIVSSLVLPILRDLASLVFLCVAVCMMTWFQRQSKKMGEQPPLTGSFQKLGNVVTASIVMLMMVLFFGNALVWLGVVEGWWMWGSWLYDGSLQTALAGVFLLLCVWNEIKFILGLRLNPSRR